MPYYIVAPARGGVSSRDFIVELTRFVSASITDTDALRYAAALPMTDFEGAMQMAAARACGARHIVTRNVRDYERSPIRAVTPRRRSVGCSDAKRCRPCLHTSL